MPVPKTPQNFVVIRSEDRESVLLSWDAVTEDVLGDPGEVDNYEIQVSEVGTGLRLATVAIVAPYPASSRQHAVLDTVVLPGSPTAVAMDPDMTYFFQVSAVNYDGNGAYTPQETDF